MKKLFATLICLFVLSMTVLPVAAQSRVRCTNNTSTYDSRYDNRSGRRYDSRYDTNVYRDSSYRNDGYRNDVYRNDPYNNNGSSRTRAIWNQHRDKITTAGGAVGGAILGGLIGGKKGALIGAITGGAGAAVYTYKIRDRYRRY
jgi:hypothetical protein